MGKITITFKIHEKQYSCEGLPENRERHFFDLMIHRSFAEGEIPSIYRSNFPEKAALSDVEILESYNQRRLRRERTLHSMKGSTTVSSANTTAINVFASPLGLNPDDSSSQTPFIASTPSPTEKGSPVQNPLRVRIPSQSMICHSGPSSFRLTPTQQSNYTRDEMQELNQFIDDVLSGPQKEASVETPKGATKKTSNLGRLRIFLQQDGADSQKMIQVKPGSSYNDVYEMARAKMGFPVALSFVDSDGMRIDIDDDDSFEMFLAREENKKMLLRVQEVEDLRNSPGSNPSLQNCVSMGSGVFSYSESRSTMVALETPVALSTHTFIGHNAAVYGCAFSPDGTTVVSASRDRTLRIWSVERGITLQTIKAHNGFVLSCDYSPRGTHVASSSDDQQIRLFSVSGKKNYTIKEHTDKVYGICFAPHGDIMMSCSCDATVRVWNVETGSRLASIKPHEKPIFRIGLSRTDNARYAVTSSDDQTSALVHWKDGRVVRKLVGHKGTVWSSAFSSDDRYVVTSSMDHSIKVWDTGSGQEICTLLGHNTPVHRAMFADVSSIAESSPGISSNEIIISCAKDRTISAWDVNSATLIYAHSGHHHTVYDLAQSGRNLVSASFDCTLRLWNTKDVICPGL